MILPLAQRLTRFTTREGLRRELGRLFGGITEKRFMHLMDGAPYRDDRERRWFNLAMRYQADLETAAIEKDEDEIRRIIDEAGVRVRRTVPRPIVLPSVRMNPRGFPVSEQRARAMFERGYRLIVIFENESGRQWLYFLKDDRDIGEILFENQDLQAVQAYEMTGMEW